MSRPATLSWFARHELRLAWRDWLTLVTAGRRRRAGTVAMVLLVFAAFMHLLAYAMVRQFPAHSAVADPGTLVLITGIVFIFWSLMLSQAMESVTRAFYARADLDLLLSAPVPAPRIFSVRIAAIGFVIAGMAMLVAAPFIDVLAWRGGARWLGAYPVAAALGIIAAAVAVALTVALFRLLGPKRTRLVAQILAAVFGAAFVISLQIAAISSFGTLNRFTVLQSPTVLAHAPAPDSLFWLPARAILGEAPAMAAILGASLLVLVAAVAIFSRRFDEHAVAAAGVAWTPGRARSGDGARFRQASPRAMLRRKEWLLLRRDPWLLSQSLMQILYLLPPAFLLWRKFGDAGTLALMIPVLVMGAGQLAGGLAWITVSGEDAPDLVATAPITRRQVVRAKVEAVFGALTPIFLPVVLVLAVASIPGALMVAAGIAASVGSAIAIQLWFASQAKRSHFRRRQTSSRIAVFAETFTSLLWAAAAGVAITEDLRALIPAGLALLVLAGAWAVSPRPADAPPRSAPRMAVGRGRSAFAR